MQNQIIKKQHIIYKVQTGSIAEELELVPGDVLLSINGQKIEDVFDYHFLINDEYIVLVVRKQDGEEWEFEIEKEYQEDLGIEFENGLMDDYRSCSNKCMFCFIDQMPPGMRSTLYFKDDDSRLSFLQGNYITLTNMKDSDIERIVRYKLAPINISVHTTNPALRCRMLGNRFAGDALKKMDRLYEAGIEMNGQIVLCKGINDGEELERTIRDLMGYLPHMKSLSVVPVGLTKYRQGLYPLEPFGEEDAKAVIALIEKCQQECYERYGIHFVHASDEWYLTAGLPLPEEERYDGYIQLENGVGMLRLLLTEFEGALGERGDYGKPSAHHMTIATGRLAAPFLAQMAEAFMQYFPECRIDVAAIRNDFFGEQITVSGLITAQDLVAQLAGRDIGSKVAVPCNMIRAEGQVFLDDQSVVDVENALHVPIVVIKSSGRDLFEAMLGIE